MRRSTALAKAVSEAIAALEAEKGITGAKAIGVKLAEALEAYRTRPEGEPEVKEAKAKAEAKA